MAMLAVQLLPFGGSTPKSLHSAARSRLRWWVVLLACFGGLLGSPAGASGAHISGPDSASYGADVTLSAHYSDASPFGCGFGEAFCYATIYYYDANDVKQLYSYCGSPFSGITAPCEFPANPIHGGERIFSDPSYAKYEVCDGIDVNCGSKVVTWAPAVVSLNLRGVSDGNGSVRALLTAGGDGFLGGYVQLYDESQRRVVPGVYGSEDGYHWDLPGCAGPYFRATLTVGGESVRSAFVRINGITDDGEPCHEDPSGGGDGGDGSGDGDGGGDPPDPPTAIIEGASELSAFEIRAMGSTWRRATSPAPVPSGATSVAVMPTN